MGKQKKKIVKRPRKTIVKGVLNKLISEFGKFFGRKRVVGKKTGRAIKRVRAGKAGAKTKLRADHGLAKAKVKPALNTKQRHAGKVAAGRIVNRAYTKPKRKIRKRKTT